MMNEHPLPPISETTTDDDDEQLQVKERQTHNDLVSYGSGDDGDVGENPCRDCDDDNEHDDQHRGTTKAITTTTNDATMSTSFDHLSPSTPIIMKSGNPGGSGNDGEDGCGGCCDFLDTGCARGCGLLTACFCCCYYSCGHKNNRHHHNEDCCCDCCCDYNCEDACVCTVM